MEDKLPEGWEWKKLDEVSDIIMGQSPPSNTYNEKGNGMPFLQGKAEFTDLYPKHVKYTTNPSKVAPEGSILISVRAPVGDVNIANIGYCIGRGLASISLRDGDNKFLFYLLRYLKPEIENKGTGSTFKAISKSILSDLTVPLPPLETQQKIVSILEKAEETKILRAQADELAQKLIQSVFLDMFGDPVNNSNNWDMIKLGECTEFMTSGSRGWARYYSDTGERFIRIQNVKNGRLDFSDIQLVEPPKTAESIRTKVKDGDLLISITADLGRTAVVDEQTALEGAYINQHLALVRLNKKIVNSVFVSQYLESEGGKRQFSSLDQIGVKSGLNFESVRSLKFYLPPLDKQKEFSSLVEKLEAIWKYQSQSSLEIDNLFNVLMQKAFMGELVTY